MRAIFLVFVIAELVLDGHAAVLPKDPGGDVRGRSPFGFHTGAIRPPFEYGFEAPFDAAVDIGVVWERPMVYFFWRLVQPDPDQERYQWASFDRGVRELPDSMRMMGNIAIGPPRMGSRSDEYVLDPRSFVPKDKAAYTRFVEAVVERYDGDGVDDMPGLGRGIKYWQVDNEPPHGQSGYAELLALTYDAIKHADPEAKVIIGGVSAPVRPHSISEYKENFDYLSILQDLGAMKKRCFDIFDYHWYGNATGDYKLVKDIHSFLRQTLAARKIPAAEEYWITEMGTYSGEPQPVRLGGRTIPGLPYQSERQQAVDLVKRYVYPLSFGVKKVFLAWGLKEGFKYDGGYFDFTGLIYDGSSGDDPGRGIRKLGYFTYKKMTEILEGSDWDRVQRIRESDGILLFRFPKAGRSIWVAWNDGKISKSVEISGVKSSRVKVTESVPLGASGGDIASYRDAFKTDTRTVENATVSLRLGGSPIYVEEL